jgi:type II secretory pathway component PulJ
MTRRPGLTILELMFGLTVVALVASIGTATLSLFSDNDKHRRREVEELARETAVRRTIIAWLEAAHASVGAVNGTANGAFQLTDAKREGRDADVLLFTTSAATSLGTGETTVRLYVDDDETTEVGLTAELSSWPGGPTARMQLDSSVTAMNVRCLTSLLGGRRWVPNWVSTSIVPRGIEIRLYGRANGLGSPFLQKPIVVAMEDGR